MQLSCSHAAYNYLCKLLTFEREEFWTISVDIEKRPLKTERLFVGTLTQCPVNLNEVYRFAYKSSAAGLIVAHNHLSGCALPSLADNNLTREMHTVGKIINIPLVDHLIISQTQYWSFADKKVYSNCIGNIYSPSPC